MVGALLAASAFDLLLGALCARSFDVSERERPSSLTLFRLPFRVSLHLLYEIGALHRAARAFLNPMQAIRRNR